jgi:FkbM family methyltransferase
LTDILSENLRRNVPEGAATVIAGAAAERSSLAHVRLASRAPDQFGLAGVEIDDRLRPGDAGVIEVHPIEFWLARSGREQQPVRLLKIDVEGGEIPVLCGAAAILERDRPEVFAEAATRPERDALDATLAPWGYRRIKRFCSTPTWHYSAQPSRLTRWRWRRMGDAARLQWRYARLRHSVVSRVRRAG